MKTRGFAQSDTGMVRSNNEDYFVCDNQLGLFIVCDGVGGNAAGEVASRLAAETVYHYFLENQDKIDQLKPDKFVRTAFQKACAVVYEKSKSDQAYSGMATTMTMLWIIGDQAVMGHVGDSRLYLKRGGTLHQISTDHTLVNDLHQQGYISKEAMETSPLANVITRSIGHEANVQVDTLLFDVLPQDRLLLCSDGLTKQIQTQEELFNFLEREEIETLPSFLVNMANKRGGDDNVTVVVVDVDPKQFTEAHAADVKLRISALKQLAAFRELTLRELLTVMEIVTVKDFSHDTCIVKEGDAGSSMYIILNGKVSVVKNNQEIAVLGQNDHFGEMALLNERPRSASVIAAEDGRMLEIKHDDFQQLLVKHSDIGVKLLLALADELCVRLEITNQQVVG